MAELRDSISQEMFECGYAQVTDVQRGIVDDSVEQVRPRTSHDLARNLQRTAEWLLAHQAFRIENFDALAYEWISFHDKEMFLDAVKAVGAGRKEFTPETICFRVDIPGGQIKLSAPRNLVCRLIRPAEYDCDPLLSPEEEKQLGGAA
jgi:hypothetical protein